MPFKDPAKRRKLSRESSRYHRAFAAGEPFALAAEQARERAKNAMSPFYALSAKHVSTAEYRRVHAECSAVREQATREYRELRAAITADRSPPAPAATDRHALLREVRRLRAALEQATAKLRALDGIA